MEEKTFTTEEIAEECKLFISGIIAEKDYDKTVKRMLDSWASGFYNPLLKFAGNSEKDGALLLDFWNDAFCAGLAAKDRVNSIAETIRKEIEATGRKTLPRNSEEVKEIYHRARAKEEETR